MDGVLLPTTSDDGTSLFIGLGTMGRPMVTRYARDRKVLVFDIDPTIAADVAADTGASVLPDLGDLPADVRTVILMLPTSRIVEGTLRGERGVLSWLRRGSLVIDMGSSEPDSTRTLAMEAADRGISYVDAPVSGGVSKARTGKLSIMVGGEDIAVDAAQDHLKSMGSTIMKVGPIGAGHAAKSLNNLLAATNLLAVAEVVCAAQSMGIDPETMIEVLNTSTGRNRASEVNFPKHVLSGTFDSGFAMDLMVKDMKIATALVSLNAVDAPIVTRAQEVAEAIRTAHPDGHPDYTELVRHHELESARQGSMPPTT